MVILTIIFLDSSSLTASQVHTQEYSSMAACQAAASLIRHELPEDYLPRLVLTCSEKT